MKPQRSAMEQALVLLGRRDYCCRGLTTALQEKGYSEAEIKETVQRLGGWGYVNDRAFAARGIDRFLQAGKSRAFIKHRLESAGVPALIIEEELQRLYPPEKEEEILRAWWRKLWERPTGRRPGAKEKTRWARKLLTAGFPPENVQTCYEQEEQEPDS